MKKKIAALMLILVTVFPIVPVMFPVQFSSSTINSLIPEDTTQIAGTRLTSFTPHVPIIINGTDDFITQGWSGSGTAEDPFLIYGLNITYDVGLPAIKIINTDAHFRIVDCLLNQLTSSEVAVIFENISHGAIEYTTIISVNNEGVELYNAPNTYISYVNVSVQNSNCLYIYDSANVVVTKSTLSSQQRAAVLEISNHFSVFDTSFVGSQLWHAFLIDSSNYSLLSGVIVDRAFTLVYLVDSYYASILSVQGTNLMNGITIANAHHIYVDKTSLHCDSTGINISTGTTNLTIAESQISAETGILGQNNVNDTFIYNSRIHSSVNGISLHNSRDIVMHDNVIEHIENNALNLENCNNVVFNDNNITDVQTDNAIVMNTVVNLTMCGNRVFNVFAHAFAATAVNKTLFAYNYFYNGNKAIEGSQVYFWDIFSNTFDTFSYGLDLQNSGSLNVSFNSIQNCENDAFSLYQISDELFIIGNDISDCSGGTGISIINGFEPLIENNTITQAQYGFYIVQSANSTIRLNTLSGITVAGITLYDSPDSKIFNNTIEGEPIAGIDVENDDDSSFIGNIMTGCGFYIRENQPLSSYFYTMIDNTVNSLPVYYTTNNAGITLDGHMYGQFIIVNSTNILIQNGTIHKATVAISLFYDKFVTVDNIQLIENSGGIIATETDNITIKDATIEDTRINDFSSEAGIYLAFANNVTISNVVISGYSEIYSSALYSYYGSIYAIDNFMSSNSYFGIRSEGTDNITVRESKFQGQYGIYTTYNSRHGKIIDCEFFDSTYGLYLSVGSSDWTILNSEFKYLSTSGIHGASVGADYVNVTGSYFEGCKDGIYSIGDYWTIVGNSFMWNTNYGLEIHDMDSPTIYANIFAGNKVGNGYESGYFSHFWDNGSIGNAWDDYSGTGPYNIPGGGSQDRYPTLYLPTTPMLSDPPDVTYPEGTEHYYMTWYAIDDYLVDWEAILSGIHFAYGAWNFHNITIDIGGLSYGDYWLQLIVYDLDRNNATDWLHIHVYDGTAPIIKAPSFVTAFVGGTDQYLRWNVSDAHPANYSIYIDEEMITEGDWTTGEITFDVSSLSAGDHTIVIEVRDIDLNGATQTVHLRMIEDSTPPTIDTPADIVMYAGSLGNVIVWNPSDEYPASFKLYLNGSLVSSGDWIGEKIVVSLNGLDVGVFQYTIYVYDGAGQSASDSVTVTVISPPWILPTSTSPTSPPLFDPLLLGIVGAGIVGVIVLFGVYYIQKRRKA